MTFSQAFRALWVSGGCGNGVPGQVNTQRDRTHIILHIDGVLNIGPIRLSVKHPGVFRSSICQAEVQLDFQSSF